MDKDLWDYFEAKEMNLLHFGFRWNFCLLLREFPAHLSIKLVDYYLSADMPRNEMCNFMILALLLKYSFEL